MIKKRERISAAKFLPENEVIYVDANIHMYFVKGRIQDLYLGEAWIKNSISNHSRCGRKKAPPPTECLFPSYCTILKMIFRHIQ